MNHKLISPITNLPLDVGQIELRNSIHVRFDKMKIRHTRVWRKKWSRMWSWKRSLRSKSISPKAFHWKVGPNEGDVQHDERLWVRKRRFDAKRRISGQRFVTQLLRRVATLLSPNDFVNQTSRVQIRIDLFFLNKSHPFVLAFWRPAGQELIGGMKETMNLSWVVLANNFFGLNRLPILPPVSN